MSNPSIKASFLLDKSGKPKVSASGDYEIRLQVEDAPEGTYRVTYELDDSYYDPLRDAIDPSSSFSEDLTSYGDYLIQARVRAKDHTLLAKRSLFDALMESYSDSTDPDILRALTDIKDN